MVCIQGNGALSHVSVRNAPDMFNEPMIFSAICIKGEKNIARVLEGPVQNWKIFGNPDTGSLGVQPAFRGQDIRTAVQQRRRKADGNFRRPRLILQSKTPFDVHGRQTEQHAQNIFGLRPQPREGLHRNFGFIHKDFRLVDVHFRYHAGPLAGFNHTQGLPAGFDGLFGYHQTIVQITQKEISAGNLGDEHDGHVAVGFFGGKHLLYGRLV